MEGDSLSAVVKLFSLRYCDVLAWICFLVALFEGQMLLEVGCRVRVKRKMRNVPHSGRNPEKLATGFGLW